MKYLPSLFWFFFFLRRKIQLFQNQLLRSTLALQGNWGRRNFQQWISPHQWIKNNQENAKFKCIFQGFQKDRTTESLMDTCLTIHYLLTKPNSHKNFVSHTYEKLKSLSSLIFTVKICCHWTCLAHSNLIFLLMPVP